MAAVWAFAPRASAQACVIVKNVECNQSPDSGNTSNLYYTFKNTNSYKVTVEATFSVVSADGTIKNLSRNMVLEAGEERQVSFSYKIFDNKYISATDSGVSFTVWKCD